MLTCRFGYNAPMSGGEHESQARCGEWELVQEIGRGTYGVVYRAMGPGGREGLPPRRRRIRSDSITKLL